jgi:hypothetical protein
MPSELLVAGVRERLINPAIGTPARQRQVLSFGASAVQTGGCDWETGSNHQL